MDGVGAVAVADVVVVVADDEERGNDGGGGGGRKETFIGAVESGVDRV